ncbi:MAG: aspartate aminotransferase family protein [Actinomycetota bacterium]
MSSEDVGPLFEEVARHAAGFIERLPKRPVRNSAGLEELRDAFDGPLPESGLPAETIIKELAANAEPGLVATTSGRFFGFVIGGAMPVTIAADWLTSAWDQNAGLYVASPASSVVEDVAGRWLIELLGLPEGASFGFVTGGQMANFTGLAAARHHVLEQRGWNVQEQGLQGAPRIRVLANETRHDTIDRALRYLGLGTGSIQPIAADDQGRMDVKTLQHALEESDAPTIVSAQAGNVNSGAFDPFAEICGVAHEHGAWVHVDGAFGLWAAASPARRALTAGIAVADSWATDAHKWLNVPYDSGVVFCAHPGSHRAAMSVHASYLIHAEGAERDQMDWNPEFSRRERGFAVYAAIRYLGRDGIAKMVDRCCDHALRFAKALGSHENIEILNDVVLNQVLVRFLSEDGDHDAKTRAVVTGVQNDGTCWMSGTIWRGVAAMRISVSNWSTTADDVDRSVEAILRVAASIDDRRDLSPNSATGPPSNA